MKKISKKFLITIMCAGLSMTVLSGCADSDASSVSDSSDAPAALSSSGASSRTSSAFSESVESFLSSKADLYSESDESTISEAPVEDASVTEASVIAASQDESTVSQAEDEMLVKEPVFEDGMAQPILKYTNLRADNYTNEGSDILRFCVYVETDHDTDSDGKADLVEALVQIPRASAEGGFKAATIYDPTPYGAGTVDENAMESSRLMNPVPFDYDKLYEPGEKRKPKGSMTTLEAAAEADPECWNYKVPYSNATGYAYAQFYDYYLVRGFAVVEAGGIGTYGSEGFELCGFDLERDAHKCVVEWLAGDRIAYTDPYNDIEIEADWSNGNVAMTGCSYGGTLPFEVATTGVKGLKTIIPFAGIASWYDYTNSQGAPLYLSAAYGNDLASFNSGAAFEDDAWTVINDEYASFLWQLSQDQDATNGNYDEIWAKSDYSLDSDKIDCSALIVHGMNDFNVTTKQSDLMARAFEKAGRNFKLVLHQDGHNILDGIVVNGELWQSIMNKWLSHYLYDVDNGIEDMPTVSVQSNVDGSFRTYDTWADFEYESFEYDKVFNPDDVTHIDTTAIASSYAKYNGATDDFGRPLLRDNYYLSMPESTKATYVFELPDNYTFYGVPEVHLKMSTRYAGGDGMVVSAMLMDTIDTETEFKAYMTKERLGYTLPVKTIGAVETGGGLPRTRVKEYVKSNTTAKLITFGHIDLANYGGGYEGKDYVKHDEEMKAGEYYDYTIYLQPTSYTFEPGHKAVLVITGWDPYCAFLDEDYMNGVVTDSVDSSYTYSFNIDNESFEFKLPQCADQTAKDRFKVSTEDKKETGDNENAVPDVLKEANNRGKDEHDVKKKEDDTANGRKEDKKGAEDKKTSRAKDKKGTSDFDDLEDISDEKLDELINLSDLEGLGEIDGTIYITGHKSPDSDTVCSSIACAELLKQLGYDAQAVVIGNINKESAYILEKAGVDAPEQLRDESGKNMIIVDHSEYSHDLDSLKDANVIGVIDHHGIGSLTTGNQVIYDARPLGSTNTVIWIRYRSYGIEPDKKMATLMLGGILSDTNNLKTNVTFADRAAVSILSKTAGIDDIESFYDGMHKEFLSHEGMTDEEIFFGDYKEYEAGGTKFCIGCINCYDEEEVKELAERMNEIMPATLKETGMDMAFAQVSVVNDDLNVCYLVCAGEGAKEAAAEALEDRNPVKKANAYVLKPGISRKTVLVPALTEVLNAYPKE